MNLKYTNNLKSLDMASPSLTNDGIMSNVQRIKPSLSHLPFEIKQCIVYWVDLIRKEPSHPEELDDDSDQLAKTSRNDHPLSARDSAHLMNLLSLNPYSRTTSTTKNLTKRSSRPKCDSILALSLIDRIFYEICRPLVWQTLDLKEFHLSKLRSLTTGGLPRNAEYVRKMWWRTAVHELEDLYPEFREELGANDEARKTQDWNEKSRSTEILRILEMCTKITSLDLDLRPTELDKRTGEFTIDENETTSKFFYPISKLTQLTSIALTSPLLANNCFTEQFVVRLIRDMSDLESFKCHGVDAVTPDFEPFNWAVPCESPLGLHLSKLKSLKELYLKQLDCFDSTWSKIEWAGNLEKLTFDGCIRNPLRTLHAFCQKFSKTLRYLKLDYVEYEEDVYTTVLQPTREGPLSEIKSGKYKLDLPELTTLCITTELPIDLLKHFEDCKNITSIELAINPSISASDIKKILRPTKSTTITSSLWPKLEKLKIIINSNSGISPDEFDAIEALYLRKGVVLEIEDEDKEIEEEQAELNRDRFSFPPDDEHDDFYPFDRQYEDPHVGWRDREDDYN
ncbi:hypothetical protein Pst134EA_022593 [Puccinia striiformis f. sp. tritici]|uniref:hypothetical protein n=2 Tax=Puccinia striiformis f. sp. tritici TaxID=168172 RepID=UPI0020084FC0|nr:hypothetical protein Pst134EA_022593 [Puccinia striiformis f. sp. tritici]KAH9455117.1 hypothetical protein Pst134EA_022593 [Puccinia striiformis f. sp. tritici]